MKIRNLPFLIGAAFLFVTVHSLNAQSLLCADKIQITDGANIGYILQTDANGNATWIDPTTLMGGANSFWQLAGNDVYNLNSGNVGIGTTTPESIFNIVGGTDVSLTSGGFLQLGTAAGSNMVIDDNEIQSRNNGAPQNIGLQREGGDIHLVAGGGNVGIGTSSPDNRLHITNGTDLTLTSGGYFQMGANANANLVFDNNEIQARNNGITGNLGLQREGGNIFMVPIGGNVGIGTENPENRLHINNGTDLSLTSGGYFQMGANANINLVFDTNEIQARDNGAPGNLGLQREGGNISMVPIGGNVGIGTENPENRLHINNGTDLNLTSGGYFQMGATANANLVFDTNEIQARNNGVAGNLGLQREGGDIHLVPGGGNVGIGTNTPESIFNIIGGTDVNLTTGGFMQLGESSSPNLVFDTNEIQARDAGLESSLTLQHEGGNLVLASGGGNVGIGLSNPTHQLDVKDAIYTQNGVLNIRPRNSASLGGELILLGSDAYPINFHIDNTENRMRVFKDGFEMLSVSSGGKMSIGAGLDNSGPYRLFVQSGIMTERVKIATVNSADWADYVFEEDYQLRSLPEIKQFVQKNKHLPNIPSAKEIEKRGYEVQEMDAKLLEKIEELYLLTIDLEERNTKLQESKTILENSNTALKKANEKIMNQLDQILIRLEDLEK